MTLQVARPALIVASVLVASCFSMACAQEDVVDEAAIDTQPRPKPVALEVWHARMQLLAGKYTEGQTQAMSEFRRIQFGRAVEEQFGESVIRFHAKVRDVRWRDGVAYIDTESEFPEERRVGRVKISTGGSTVRLRRNSPLEVMMEHEDAAAILPDSLVKFEGRLDYHSALERKDRPRDVQELYTVEHEQLGKAVGVFTSNDFVCTFGKSTYPGRWNTDAPEE